MSDFKIYTRICVDCGKVMRNVGRRTERCPECRAVHIRVKALEASYRERTEQLIRQQEERAGAIIRALWTTTSVSRQAPELTAKAASKRFWPHKRKSSPPVLAHRQAARVDGFYKSHHHEDITFSEVLQDGKKLC